MSVFTHEDMIVMRVAAQAFNPDDRIEDVGDPENGPSCQVSFGPGTELLVIVAAIGMIGDVGRTRAFRDANPYWGATGQPGGPPATYEAELWFEYECERVLAAEDRRSRLDRVVA